MKIARITLFAIILGGGLLLLAPRAYAGHVARNTACPTTGGGQNCAEQQPSGQTWYYCGATCQSLPADLGSSYTLNCGTSSSPNTCAWQCQSPHVVCGGSCGNSQATGNGTENFNDGDADLTDGKLNDCGTIVCRTDYVMCGGDCRLPQTASCPTGTTLNQCTGACDSPYVLISPAVAQSGYINVTGNIGTASGDFLLNSGQAIKVAPDSNDNAVLNLGNFKTDNSEKNFTLTLHAGASSVGELIFQQGSDDRWALSVRPNDPNTGVDELGDFEIRRNAPNWPRVLALDFATGDVIIDTNLTVSGQLQLANLGSAPASPLGPGALYWSTASGNTGVKVYNGTGWESVGITYTAGDYLTIGADNKISATHSGTCFGPVFDGLTTENYDGNLDKESSNQDGYKRANQLCGVGRHMCSTAEILNGINCSTPNWSDANLSGKTFWVSAGAPSLPTPLNDCGGWTSLDVGARGVAWVYNTNGGTAGASECNNILPLACCK